jgi:uncharacterized repeat protein (TIGR03803 family)
MSDTHLALKYFLSKLALLPAILGLIVITSQIAQTQTETILYSFCAQPNCGDGAGPSWVTPVFDKKGNLYGTTWGGGAYSCNHGGCGTVFELTPSGTETILHSFDNNGTDGYSSWGGVILDNEGNLYGTTLGGGSGGLKADGTVFELTPSGTETILHGFESHGADGYWPNPGLVRDADGNLYGTTSEGGAYSSGTVFKVTPSGTETILHSFDLYGTDGAYPANGLVVDKKGNLYGTTVMGGAYLEGTVFKLTPSGTETILYSFGASGDGYYPIAGLVFDKKGNLYGTTVDGGAYSHQGNGCALYGCGTVFKLTPSGTETILHSFGASGDGYQLNGGLIFDKKGNLYGATYRGGDYCAPYGCGTVFRLTP